MSLIEYVTAEVPSGFMQTATGKIVNPMQLTRDDISVRDIAIALGNICRYGGHCQFMSVAEHSVNVSKWVLAQGGSIQQQLAGLFHDAHEAYLGDVIRPIKTGSGATFRELIELRELAADDAISQVLGMTVIQLRDPIVKAGDEAVLKVELGNRRGIWQPTESARQFMNRYQLLQMATATALEAGA